MAFARIALFPGGTEAQHRAVSDALGDAQVHADGRVFFAAGPVPEGWQILQVWESRDHMEKWVSAYLGEAFAKAGNRGYAAPPTITDLDLTELLT